VLLQSKPNVTSLSSIKLSHGGTMKNYEVPTSHFESLAVKLR
jgi:hypothetical protein